MAVRYSILTVLLFAVVGLAYGQARDITGTVTEEGTGFPLPGVNIQIQGTLTGTITGIDGTFSQTVFARHGYYPEDILWGHRFVDAIDSDDAGRPRFDFSRFHLTHPEP